MPFFTGFAGQFGKDLAASRAEEADRAERQNALESAVLQHLATSTDPEIQSHAITGLLDLAGPQKRAGGLAGWLGKMAAHPALPTIRQLVSSGRQEEVPTDGAVTGVSGVPRGIPSPAGAPSSTVPAAPSAPAAPGRLMGPPSMEDLDQGGAAAVPGPVAATPPPSAPPARPTTRTVPREIFRTPERQAELTAAATTRGQLQGKVDVLRGTGGQPPLTDEEQELLFPGRAPLSTGTLQGKDAPYGAVDNSGRPLSPMAYYTTKADPRDPSKVTYFPSAPPASVTNQAAIAARPVFQHYVGPDGKTPGVWRVSRDGSKPPEFIGYSGQKGTYLRYVDPDTQEVSYIAAPPVYFPGATLQATSQAPAGPAAAPAVAQAPPGATTPPAPAPAAAGAPPRGAGAPPAAPRAAGPKGLSGGRKRTLTQTEGAYLGPDGQPQVGRALYDAGTGKYYAVEDPAREATGFIPGGEGAYAVQAYSQANNTLITIAAAKKALEDAGLVTNNDPAATARFSAQFFGGTVGSDPLLAAVTSLTNLAGLQGATQYIRSNSRSYAMFQQALMHLPRVPSERVAQISQLPVIGGLATPTTAGLAGSHGWDSPASMYRKLEQAEAIIKQGKGSLAELTGKTAERAVGAGGGAPPAPGGGGAAPGAAPAAPTSPQKGERRIVQGVEAEWDGRGWVKVQR